MQQETLGKERLRRGGPLQQDLTDPSVQWALVEDGWRGKKMT